MRCSSSEGRRSLSVKSKATISPLPRQSGSRGTLENAQAMAAHESPRTTKLYDDGRRNHARRGRADHDLKTALQRKGALPLISCPMFLRKKALNKKNSAAAKWRTRWAAMARRPSGRAFFGFRPGAKWRGWKNGDRYDGRAHEGGCILGQHVARSQPNTSPRRQVAAWWKKKGEWKQIALGEHTFVQENRKKADE